MNGDPQPGDKVRVTFVTTVEAGPAFIGNNSIRHDARVESYSVEIIERAKPEYPVGAVFTGNYTGAVYFKTSEENYVMIYPDGEVITHNADYVEREMGITHHTTVAQLVEFRSRIEAWANNKFVTDTYCKGKILDILEETK